MAFFHKKHFVKLCAIIMLVVLTVTICSCELIPTPKPPLYAYTVTYVAGEGGHIVGDDMQSIIQGQDATEVEAVADEGYTFVEWSDGIETAKRTDRNVTEDLTVTALFSQNPPQKEPDDDPKPTRTVTYVAGEGGHIVGNTMQSVTDGDNAAEVEAVADNGYTFAGWSDGIETSKRTDTNVTESFTVTALFSPNPQTDGSLPTLAISTDDGQEVYSKDVYKTCKISVSNAEAKYCFENESANIRGRGNSSWEWPKKPYKLKFDSKIDLFGNGKAKKWTLIANYCDYSMSRNYMVYSLAQEFEQLSKTTTTTQFVELYFNGRYEGVYLVCEQVETGSNRVDIEDSLKNVTDPEQLGFLIELDRRVVENGGVPNGQNRFVYDGDYFFKVNSKYLGDTCFILKSPDYDDAMELGLNYNVYVDHVQSYMNNAFEVLWSGNYNAVKEKFDVQSWAEGYIIDELFKTVDVSYSSFYMFKDNKDGKLYRGPLWDFDISSDNCNYYDPINNANSIYATRNTIYKKLLEYSEFRALVTAMLREKVTLINATLDNCVNYVFAHSEAFERNFNERWNLLNWGNHEGWCPVPNHLRAMTTWQEHVTHLRSWLNNSLNYMLTQYR